MKKKWLIMALLLAIALLVTVSIVPEQRYLNYIGTGVVFGTVGVLAIIVLTKIRRGREEYNKRVEELTKGDSNK